MTKHDWFWVFVKVAGMALLGYAVFTVVVILTLLGDVPVGEFAMRILLNVGLIGGAGIWLIRDGKLLTDWAKASDR